MTKRTAKFFVGTEACTTPAFSKKTLFVVGNQDIDDILDNAIEHDVDHIYLGANLSFGRFYDEMIDSQDQIIDTLLGKGYMVTIDYPAHLHEIMLRTLRHSIWNSRFFIPLLNVQVPAIESSNDNLTIKFDDSNSDYTVNASWCLHYHQATDSNRYTSWEEYANDVAIESEEPVAEKEVSESKNDQSIGLDPDSASKLKPEENDTSEIHVEDFADVDPIEAYTTGVVEPEAKKEAKSVQRRGKSKK